MSSQALSGEVSPERWFESNFGSLDARVPMNEFLPKFKLLLSTDPGLDDMFVHLTAACVLSSSPDHVDFPSFRAFITRFGPPPKCYENLCSSVFQKINGRLHLRDWFAGFSSRESVEGILQNAIGHFCLRLSSRAKDNSIILSYFDQEDNQIQHAIVACENGLLDGNTYEEFLHSISDSVMRPSVPQDFSRLVKSIEDKYPDQGHRYCPVDYEYDYE